MEYKVTISSKIAGHDVTLEAMWLKPHDQASDGLDFELQLTQLIDVVTKLQAEKHEPIKVGKRVTVEGGDMHASMDKGEWKFKLHAGIWKKYGVPVYPEVLNAAQIEFLKKHGKAEMQNYDFVIELDKDDKPRRVVFFQKRAE